MAEIPFHEARELLEDELSKYTAKAEGDQEFPPYNISNNKGKSIVSFGVSTQTDLYEVMLYLLDRLADWEGVEVNRYGSALLLKKDGRGIILSQFAQYSKSVTFEKEGDLESEDIETILEVYKLGNKLEEVDNPREKLLEYGVKIYEGDKTLEWDVLAGYEEVKQEVIDTVVLSLEHPEAYEQVMNGTRVHPDNPRPKAVLFEGPPGTGKTTCARIIGSQVDIPLIYVPIESIMTKWYGESSRNLAGIFDICDELGSALIFLDEIDSLARSRGGHIHEATQRVLSVLLRKIDGFDSKRKSILIGATNRKDDLDPALLRRFDASIHFPLPNEAEREAIFGLYAKQLRREELARLACEARAFSGSDIETLCGKTERRWASKLVRGEAEGELPPLEEYLESLREIDKADKSEGMGFLAGKEN